jgi:hypothetical protein
LAAWPAASIPYKRPLVLLPIWSPPFPSFTLHLWPSPLCLLSLTVHSLSANLLTNPLAHPSLIIPSLIIPPAPCSRRCRNPSPAHVPQHTHTRRQTSYLERHSVRCNYHCPRSLDFAPRNRNPRIRLLHVRCCNLGTSSHTCRFLCGKSGPGRCRNNWRQA